MYNCNDISIGKIELTRVSDKKKIPTIVINASMENNDSTVGFSGTMMCLLHDGEVEKERIVESIRKLVESFLSKLSGKLDELVEVD